MILYHGEPNLFALTALIGLEEAGLAYDSRPMAQVPLEHAVSGYPAETAHRINIEREGPVLVDGAVMVTGSFFLLEYLAESYPKAGLLPADPRAQYRALAIGQTVANMVAPFVVALGLARYPVPLTHHDLADLQPCEQRGAWSAAMQPSDASDCSDRLRPTLERLEGLLGEGGDWFLGAYSIVDIDVFATIRNLPDLTPGLLDATPRLIGLIDRTNARPATRVALGKATVAHPERVFTPGPEISRWG
jgi:glutathione S-transferase